MKRNKGKITKEAFAEGIKAYQQDMYRMAYGYMRNEEDAKDAVSETVLKSYEKRELLQEPEKFKSWIMTILVNTCKDMLKRQSREVLTDEMCEMEKTFEQKNDEMWDIVLKLDKEYREIILLYYCEEWSTKKISKVLHIVEGSVKSRLTRARKQLRQILEVQ